MGISSSSATWRHLKTLETADTTRGAIDWNSYYGHTQCRYYMCIHRERECVCVWYQIIYIYTVYSWTYEVKIVSIFWCRCSGNRKQATKRPRKNSKNRGPRHFFNHHPIFLVEPSGKAVTATNVEGMSANSYLWTDVEIIWTQISPILFLYLLSLQEVALWHTRVLHLWLIDAQGAILHEIHDVHMPVTTILLRALRHGLLRMNLWYRLADL